MSRRSTYAAEARLYWIAASRARSESRKKRVNVLMLSEYCDELDAISHCTEWKRLRTVCCNAIDDLEPFNNACAS